MADDNIQREEDVTSGAGFTQIILPTQMLADMSFELKNNIELTKEQKEELLSAIMRELGA